MPGRITDELRRITREQGGGSRDASRAPDSAKGGAPHGRTRFLFGAILLAALVAGGWWLVQRLQADSKLQDCVMSGRKNCVPSQ